MHALAASCGPSRAVRLFASLALGLFPPAAVIAASPGTGDEARYDEKAALEFSQAAIGHSVGHYRFIDQHGKTVELAALRGRPVIVSLIFTSCFHTCPMLTANLARVVDIARDALGEESFHVLTVGFDTAVDTPERMRSYARERGVSTDGWSFVSAESATIEALTADLGFIFFPSPRGFDHLAQTTVIDAEGRVYTQVYGATYQPPALVEPLKRLVFGTGAGGSSFSGWVQGIRLFCTVYDPASGRYRFDYSLFVMIGAGLAALGAIAVFLVHAWQGSRGG